MEVDSSTYAIPTPQNVATWVDACPRDFKFHFKAFGCLVNGGSPLNSLPRDIRDCIDKSSGSNKYVTFEKMGTVLVEKVKR